MWSFPKATISWVHCALAAAFKVATLAQRRGFGAWFQNKEFHGITVSWRRPSRPPYLHGAADSRHGFRTRDFMGSQYLGGGLQGRHTCATPRVRGMVSEHGISWDHSVVAAASRPPHLRGAAGSELGFRTWNFMGSQCRSGGLQGRQTCATPRVRGMVSEHGISWVHSAVAAAFKAATPARFRGFVSWFHKTGFHGFTVP